MVIETRFGVVEYSEADRILFPNGIPGFESLRYFLLIPGPDHSPILLLQSLDESSICFFTLPVDEAVSDYRLAISREDRDALAPEHIIDPGRLLSLSILSIHENGEITANLLGPVVIYEPERRGVQAIRHDTLYSAFQTVMPRGEGVQC